MAEQAYQRGKPISIELADIGNGHKLEKYAAKAYLAMAAAALKNGIPFVINSSFRSNEKQTSLYVEYVKQLAAFKRGERGKPSLVAPPGKSTHQSGLSVDINRAPGDNPATKAADSPTDLWLQKNAYRFGFFNDVKSEAWHWTFLPEII
jgi:LAS superfamily LD-carboxypeptidase LdcB